MLDLGEQGELLVGLLGRRQLGSRVHELLVIDVEQLRLLGVEVQAGLVVVEILEPLKKLRVGSVRELKS